jgi:hypothetical protein
MKKNLAKISLLTLIAAAIIAVPVATPAQDAGTNAPAADAPVKKAKKAKNSLVFRGAASAVDTNAMTLTVGQRTFDVTADTKITKDGQPAVLGDINVGEMVGGAYKKGTDGKLSATTIRIGLKKKKDASAGTTMAN